MRTERSLLIALLGIAPLWGRAQLMPDPAALDSMRSAVRFLANDALEGREAGTPGERAAAEYVAARFKAMGLVPKGDDGGYLQAFTFNAQPVLGPNNRLNIGRSVLTLGEQFHPLAFSASAGVRGKLLKVGYGIQAPELDRMDYNDQDVKGRIVAINISSPDGIHPHSKFLAYHDLHARAEKAAALGAVGVLFYTDDPDVTTPSAELSAKVQACSVPVMFVKGNIHIDLVVDNNPCVMNADIQRPQSTAYNVVGMLDNGMADVVVIGAHFDHLGWGDEGSLHRGEKAIHNGADDNASGVAVMIQLARDLRQLPGSKANDILFIAFSGEEKGLFGSNYWTKNPTVPVSELNYMVNLDMVGRLDSAGSIGLNGVGTSPAWAEVDSLPDGNLKVKTTASGVGPSDHTSFYLQGVPAIHFFTGTHADYHKPSDDEEKINYPGMLRVTRYIEALIAALNDNGKLAFTKTQDANSEEVPRFKVTLGVVPDYLYDGKGMRIDGITEGKPAANAGLEVGDVVIRMGTVDVVDMMSYMKGLSAFNKGDTAPVKVLRNGSELEKQVTF
ncbi:MAG: M28 family peptidase [Flavobacteriales bacterium]|nr:M28 family peptidase [Flavobacteriales bacterium]